MLYFVVFVVGIICGIIISFMVVEDRKIQRKDMADRNKDLIKKIKKLGYKGCKNCIHQLTPLRTCEWMERGGDKVVHFVCPKWKKGRESDGRAKTE